MDSNIVSGVIGLVGVLIGGTISWFASLHTTKINIRAQNKVIELQKEKEEKQLQEEKRIYASIILNDFYNALYNSFHKEINKIALPMYKEYQKLLIGLKDELGKDKFEYLYNMYGIIEQIHFSVLNNDLVGYESKIFEESHILNGYKLIKNGIFPSEKIQNIEKMPIEQITKDFLIGETNKEFKDLKECLEKIAK